MLYAMSDIHGYLDALKQKLELVDLSGNNRIIFLGDYIDYGSDSGDVLRCLYDYQQKHGKDKVIMLKGNHEVMFLEWIDEFGKKITPFMEAMVYDSWLKTDSEQDYNTFRTLVSNEQFESFTNMEQKASFAAINAAAVKLVLENNRKLVGWIRSMGSFYETDRQIFVHAGVDEDAGEDWKWGTGDEIFLWKYPAMTGAFCKTIIAGHVGTGSIAGHSDYHDIYYDGKSHYYIDGLVYKQGKLLLLAYEESENKYYQVEKEMNLLLGED